MVVKLFFEYLKSASALTFFCCLVSVPIWGAPIVSTNAKATALGNAVTADNIGVDSTSFNPATLTLIPMGEKGKSEQLKLLMLPFPDYSIRSNKPAEGEDPINDIGLLVNDCISTCLFGDSDPRDTPWNPEIEKIAVYIPGYGEIDAEADLFDLILLPMSGKAYRPSRNSKFVFSSSVHVPIAGGVHLKKESWNIEKTTASIGAFGFAPSFAYEVTPSWSIGMGINFAISGTKLGHDYRVPSLTLGVVNEFIDSVCGSVSGVDSAEVCRFAFESDISPNDPFLHFYFEGKDKFTWSFNLGVLWEPAPWLKWGLSYRNKTKFKMKGDGGLILHDNLYNLLSGAGNDIPLIQNNFFGGEELVQDVKFNGALSLSLPTQIDTGVSIQLTNRLKLNVDYHWKESSLFNDTSITIPSFDSASGEAIAPFLLAIFTEEFQPGLPQSIVIGQARGIDLRFKDVGSFSYGISYRFSDRLVFRSGFEKKVSPIDSDEPFGLLDDIKMYGIGLGYQWNKNSTLDIAYSRLDMKRNDRADESILTSARYQPLALFAGMHLSSYIEVNMIQINWTKRL